MTTKIFAIKPIPKKDEKPGRMRLVRAETKKQAQDLILADFLVEPVTDLVAEELQAHGINIEEVAE